MTNRATAENVVHFEWVEAPPDLAGYLNSLYVLKAGPQDIVEMMPAYSAQLCILLRGGGEMTFHDGHTAEARTTYFLGPLTQAQKFTVHADTVVLGASLNVRGWASLTGLPADKAKDRTFAVKDVLTPEATGRLEDVIGQVGAGELEELAGLDVLAEVIRQGLKPLTARHEQIIAGTLAWLSGSFKPQISELMDMLPYSDRQVQRLVSQFFGQPPVKLIRRFRAIRAGTLMTMDNLDPKLEAEIRSSFYDQAHMIKEIRHFVGKTPRRLQPGGDSMVRETLGEPGYGSVDLFAGNHEADPQRRK